MGVVNVASVRLLPIPSIIFQLGIGIGNWQYFHIGNIIYIIYTFYTARNLIRSLNSQLTHSSTPNSSTILRATIHNQCDKKRQ